VREQRVAHAVEAWTFPLTDGAALLLIEATAQRSVAPADLEVALGAELDLLGDDPPGEQELARVRLRRATNRASAMQQAEERADRLGMYAALLDDPDRTWAEQARDAAVTPEAIRDAARSWLAPDNRAVVWYLPPS
jgi:predicted Zn-dependent peptidase